MEPTTILKIVLTSHYHRNRLILKPNENKMRKSLEKKNLSIFFHLSSSSLIKALLLNIVAYINDTYDVYLPFFFEERTFL